jgi:hypothetical protein
LEKYDSSKEDESDEDRDREAIGGVNALFVISVVLRRLNEVVMLVGARGSFSIQVSYDMEGGVGLGT